MNRSKLFIILIEFSIFSIAFTMEGETKKLKVDPNHALATAISAGNVQGVLHALEQGADVNLKLIPFVGSVFGGTRASSSSMFCALEEQFDDQEFSFTNFLFQFLVGPTLPHKESCSPLHVAVSHENIEIVQALLTQLPTGNMLPSLFTLLCCFKRFKTMKHTIDIPRDIQLMLCRYALRANVNHTIDNHLKALQPSLESKHKELTPYGLACERRQNLEYEQNEIPSFLTLDEFYRQKANLNAIARLLDPKDDQYRREIIHKVLYTECINKIPGVSEAEREGN